MESISLYCVFLLAGDSGHAGSFSFALRLSELLGFRLLRDVWHNFGLDALVFVSCRVHFVKIL